MLETQKLFFFFLLVLSKLNPYSMQRVLVGITMLNLVWEKKCI